MSYATVDLTQAAPRVTFPRAYNAAADLVDRHVEQGRGDKVAYRFDGGTVTYAQLQERIDRAGNALLALGVRREERVALALLDTVDFVACFLGAMKLGAVPVPLNTLLAPADYAHLLQDSRARVLVVSDALQGKLGPAIASASELAHVVSAPTPLGGERGEALRLEALLAAAAPRLSPARTSPDDVAFWLYSSGSTGAPKGAMHLHSSLMWTSALYAQGVLGLRPEDVCYSAAKLFFAYGLGNALTFPLAAGASAVLVPERVTPEVVGRTLRAHRPTLFFGVPTLFASVLADGQLTAQSGGKSLRQCVSAGEALPAHVGEKWKARLGVDILDGIGSTELLHIFISNRPGEVRYGSTGRAVPGYELELRGDDGHAVAEGEEGALWVRGPTAAMGYWNQREKSLATFEGAWTRTGDRYAKDAAGYFTYCGRGDDMLKVGGIWVSPFEVESALASHEAVLEAAVVGHADDEGLVKPRAFVVLKEHGRAGPELEGALKAHVKEKLAPFKYPRWVEFVAELPKTATGKIQRFRLRAG